MSPSTGGRSPRILIVNPFGIGDVLFTTPLVRAVRRAFPTAYLAYLCNRRTQDILRTNEHLDELFIYEKDELVGLWKRHKWEAIVSLVNLIRRIKQQRFGLVIDLSLGERYSFLLALVGVPRRIGFDFHHRGRFLTHRFAMDGYQDRHVVEYYRWLLAMVGVRMVESHLELKPSEYDRADARQRLARFRRDPDQRIIGLVPAGGISWGLHANFRRWSKEGFIRIGQVLRERYQVTILLFGEMRDQAVCAEIAAAIGPAAVDLSGQTTLSAFVGLISECHLVIANDGGPVHIAVSQDVPTVSIFGPVDPQVYGPYPRTDKHRIVRKFDLPCRPCYQQFKLPPCPYERACLTSIEPSDVLQACQEVLRNAPARSTDTGGVQV